MSSISFSSTESMIELLVFVAGKTTCWIWLFHCCSFYKRYSLFSNLPEDLLLFKVSAISFMKPPADYAFRLSWSALLLAFTEFFFLWRLMFAREAFMPRFKTTAGAIFLSLDILYLRDILNFVGFSYALSCAFSAKGFWKNILCDLMF